MMPEVKYNHEYGTNNAAEQFEAAVPDCENRGQIVLKLVPIMDNIKEPRPADPGNKRIQGGVGDKLRVGRDFAAEQTDNPHGRHKADDHHQAVGLDGQVGERNSEQFRMHYSL
jgi:hypothetical protein